jgi:membrane protease subunit HflK
VTLRTGTDEEATATMLDPANQSLADALRITFWILQAGMLVILALFLLSGFQSIRENEAGIRLLFGRKTSDEPLDPGFRFSAPYPIGELVKVGTSNVTFEIDEAFWQRLSEEQKRMTLQQLATAGKQKLIPGEDGSLVTGDRNLAHAKWTVSYRRSRPADYAENVLPEHEDRIVRAAVQRGIVEAVAQTSIDALLKQSETGESSIATRARVAAQQVLDRIGAGIEIDRLTLGDKTPPLIVLRDFTEVQSAEQRAGKAREDADARSRNILNDMAGAVHPYLTAQIDAYERAVERADQAEQDRVLETIFALLDGRPVTVGDQRVDNLVSGKVSAMLNEARQYKTAIVSRRAAELATFEARLTQFKSNPEVMIKRDWADALMVFMGRDNVEKFYLPPGTRILEVVINPDPAIRRAIEKAIKLEENLRSLREREVRQRAERFRTDTESQPADIR